MSKAHKRLARLRRLLRVAREVEKVAQTQLAAAQGQVAQETVCAENVLMALGNYTNPPLFANLHSERLKHSAMRWEAASAHLDAAMLKRAASVRRTKLLERIEEKARRAPDEVAGESDTLLFPAGWNVSEFGTSDER